MGGDGGGGFFNQGRFQLPKPTRTSWTNNNWAFQKINGFDGFKF